MQAAVDGPSGSAVLRLALDTGATGTVINVGMLVAIGYDPALVPERIQVTTGSGVVGGGVQSAVHEAFTLG